jgi:hypothetical protein
MPFQVRRAQQCRMGISRGVLLWLVCAVALTSAISGCSRLGGGDVIVLTGERLVLEGCDVNNPTLAITLRCGRDASIVVKNTVVRSSSLTIRPLPGADKLERCAVSVIGSDVATASHAVSALCTAPCTAVNFFSLHVTGSNITGAGGNTAATIVSPTSADVSIFVEHSTILSSGYAGDNKLAALTILGSNVNGALIVARFADVRLSATQGSGFSLMGAGRDSAGPTTWNSVTVVAENSFLEASSTGDSDAIGVMAFASSYSVITASYARFVATNSTVRVMSGYDGEGIGGLGISQYGASGSITVNDTVFAANNCSITATSGNGADSVAALGGSNSYGVMTMRRTSFTAVRSTLSVQAAGSSEVLSACGIGHQSDGSAVTDLSSVSLFAADSLIGGVCQISDKAFAAGGAAFMGGSYTMAVVTMSLVNTPVTSCGASPKAVQTTSTSGSSAGSGTAVYMCCNAQASPPLACVPGTQADCRTGYPAPWNEIVVVLPNYVRSQTPTRTVTRVKTRTATTTTTHSPSVPPTRTSTISTTNAQTHSRSVPRTATRQPSESLSATHQFSKSWSATSPVSRSVTPSRSRTVATVSRTAGTVSLSLNISLTRSSSLTATVTRSMTPSASVFSSGTASNTGVMIEPIAVRPIEAADSAKIAGTATSVVMSISTAAALGNPVVASQGSRLAQLRSALDCSDGNLDVSQPDSTVNPFDWSVGGATTPGVSKHVGAVVTGLGINFILLAVAFTVAAVRHFVTRTESSRPFIFALHWVRLPSLFLFPLMFTSQAVATSAVVAIGRSEDDAVSIAAGSIGLSILALPAPFLTVLHWKFIRTAFAARKLDTVHFRTNPIRWILHASHDWVSMSTDPSTARAHEAGYGLMLEPYSSNFQWFVVVEIGYSFAGGIAGGLFDVTQCMGPIACNFCMALAHCAMLLIVRPFCRPVDAILQQFCSFVQVAGFICALVVQTNSSESARTAGEALALCGSAIATTLGIYEIVQAIHFQVEVRRRRNEVEMDTAADQIGEPLLVFEFTEASAATTHAAVPQATGSESALATASALAVASIDIDALLASTSNPPMPSPDRVVWQESQGSAASSDSDEDAVGRRVDAVLRAASLYDSRIIERGARPLVDMCFTDTRFSDNPTHDLF